MHPAFQHSYLCQLERVELLARFDLVTIAAHATACVGHPRSGGYRRYRTPSQVKPGMAMGARANIDVLASARPGNVGRIFLLHLVGRKSHGQA